MRISDWSSDVCSSDLPAIANPEAKPSTQVSKPVASKPDVRKPAENKAATTVASKSTPWWISSGNGKGLQVIYDGSAAFERAIVVLRWEERRVGKECVSTCIQRWSLSPEKKKNK